MKRRKKITSVVTLPRVALLLGAGAITLIFLLIFLPESIRVNSSGALVKKIYEPAQPSVEWNESTFPSTLVSPEPRTGIDLIPIAIVVDDAGHNVADAEAYLHFPGKLSVAVLPQLAFSEEVAARALQAGKEVILHLPMEPEGPSDPGPGAIRVSYDTNEVIERLEENFSSVVTRGVNNHMGSRATADARIMNMVMAYLKKTDRFFLDSRTTPDSVASDAATRHGVPFLSRDVFLDVTADEETVNAAFDRGMTIGREKGSAILIGHVTNQVVVSVLERRIEEIEEAGFELVYLSELLP